MFAGGVRFHTAVVFLIHSVVVVVACVIFIRISWFLPMSWVLHLSISLSICRVYMYVRLIMPGYLFFCIYFNVWYHMLSKMRSSGIYILRSIR